MKRVGKLGLLTALLLLVLGAAKAAAQSTQNFTIQSFSADYYLNRNQAGTSTLHTIETIQAEFPGIDQNHGILRAIPKSYQGHSVSLIIDSVTDENNRPLTYKTSTQNDNLVLKIGDAGAFVHGLRIYKITYDAKNVAALLAGHDEFYWDVNGDQWQQPFLDITARLHISANLAASLQDRRACYFGATGYSNTSRCSIGGPTTEGTGQLITFEAKNGAPGETMTIVTAFGAGTFKLGPEIAQEKHAKQIKYAAIAAGTIAPALLASIFLYTQWSRFGRDPKGRGVIIPEYQPPQGLNSLTSDYIYLEKLDQKAISALVVELAVRKYITIYEVVQKKRLQKDTTSYKLKLIREPSDLTAEERQVVNMFFPGSAVGAESNLWERANSMSGDVKQLKKMLGTNLSTAGYFRNDPNGASAKYYGIGALLGIGGGLFLLYIGLFPLIDLSIALAGLAFIVFSRYMPSRSELGVAVHDHMLGLKDYIKLAESERLRFLQSPQGAEKVQEAGLKPDDPQFRVKLFESLLPYAMIFGLEKDWAKQFEGVYAQAPGWYNGNWATFNTVYLASSLGGFSSANSMAFSAPHSSGSSGFGGGFSGGGGGGGGGGGW